MRFVGKYHSDDEFRTGLKNAVDSSRDLSPVMRQRRIELPGSTGAIEAMALLCIEQNLALEIKENAFKMAMGVAMATQPKSAAEIDISSARASPQERIDSKQHAQSAMAATLLKLTSSWSGSKNAAISSSVLSFSPKVDEFDHLYTELSHSIALSSFQLEGDILSKSGAFGSAERSLMTDFIGVASSQKIEKSFESVDAKLHRLKFSI